MVTVGTTNRCARRGTRKLIAGFVFQHPSIASLRRELLRNGQLRARCGSTRSRVRRQCQANTLLDQMQERHPQLLERCSRLSVDKGYDGEVSCMCPQTGGVQSMVYGGFERDRETLKYRCPARYSGITCKRIEQCPASEAGAHSAGRGSAGVHAGGAFQLPVAGLLRPTPRGGAGQQPVGRRFRVRATGHPRAGQDAAARHGGDDDHAGDGLGAHPGRPTGTPAEPGQTRLTGDSPPVITKAQSTGCAAGQVCPELSAEPRMRLDSSSRVSVSTLDIVPTPPPVCASEAHPRREALHLARLFFQPSDNPIQLNCLVLGMNCKIPLNLCTILPAAYLYDANFME